MKGDRLFLIAAALAAAAIVLAYSNSLHNSFHYDDDHVIVRNVYIRSLHNVPRFFRDARTFSVVPANATYRPLVTLTYALDYRIGAGLDPVQFHITQIVLLLVIWLMLIVFFQRALDVSRPSLRNRWIALTSATIFAVHTVNTETMNLISARSEEIAAIGILGAFLLIQFSPRARRWHLYLIPFAAGAMAKAQIVAFAPLLLAYFILIERQSIRRKETWIAVLPSFVTALGLLALLHRLNGPQWSPGHISRWRYFITQGWAWMHYTRLFFLPIGLSADTDRKPFELWTSPSALAGFAFVAILLVVIRALARREDLKPVAFGLSWYAIALIPTSSIYPLAEVVNEHRIFLPYMGLALAVVFWLDKVLERHRRMFACITIGSVLGLVAGTMVRNSAWATDETLWRDTIRKSPQNGRALMNYGLTEMAKGNYAAAKTLYERAQKLDSASPVLEVNLGTVEGALGNSGAAEQHFLRALSLRNDADGHYHYGRWLVRAGRAKEAITHLATALAIDPAHVQSRSLLIKLYAAIGNSTELARLAREARSYDPNDGEAAIKNRCPTARACFDEGVDAIGNKEFLDAALANREAIRYDPRFPDAWINLGWSLAQMGFDRQAEQAFLRALDVKPGDDNALGNLRWLREGKRAQVR